MRKIHPLTGLSPDHDAQLIVRGGGVTGLVGSFGWTRRTEAGNPKMHEGIDWLAKVGDRVFAAHSGTVTRDREQGGGRGYGWRYYIDDNGLITRYGHLSGQLVKRGRVVHAGDLIGWVGRSGNVTDDVPTHLHFEVREGPGVGEPVDPIWWLHDIGDRYGVAKRRARA